MDSDLFSFGESLFIIILIVGFCFGISLIGTWITNALNDWMK